ncbi:MAG: amidohydrolase family protein [Acidobacteria bacterium]|nr:amidohydrolase family protein [Acidobacteriota bacterium]
MSQRLKDTGRGFLGFRSSAMLYILSTAFCVLLSAGQVQAQNQPLVLRGATLIDVASSTRLEDSVVVLERGRIRAVGKAGGVSFPTDARVIDLKGKYLLPGLIDCHVHYRDWLGEVLLANGITSVLDQANPTEWSFAFKEAQQKGKVRAPRFFVTGNQLDGSPVEKYSAEFGYLDSWIGGGVLEFVPLTRQVKYADFGRLYKTYLDEPEEARREVRLLIQRGVDAIKVHHRLAPEVLKAITDEAHRAGLSVVGHRLDARELAELGMDFVEHTSPVAIATITDQQKLQELKEGKLLDPHPFMDRSAFPGLVRTLVAKKIYFNPTLSGTWRGVCPRRKEYRAELEKLFGQPGLKYIPRSYLKNHLDHYDLFDRITPSQAQLLQDGYRNVERFLKSFVDAGGKLLAGSDPAGTGIPGLGLHQEMELMVDAGARPMEALRAATLYAAQLLHKEKELGTVEAGKLADLVVLAGDPLIQISNTRKIEMVILGGEQVDTSFHPDYSIPIPRAVSDPREDMVASTIANVLPNVATEGSPDLTVDLTGRFLPSSRVTFNEVPIQSSFESPAKIRAVIPSSMLAKVGTYSLQVVDSFPGLTSRSNRIFFVVKYR